MNYNFQYSFSDEVASKYDCDYLNKQLEIYFSGFTDLFNNKYYESHCKFIIREWENAKIKLDGESEFVEFESNNSPISMIYSIVQNGNSVELFVNTIDNRYYTIYFENPFLELIVL